MDNKDIEFIEKKLSFTCGCVNMSEVNDILLKEKKNNNTPSCTKEKCLDIRTACSECINGYNNWKINK